MHAAVVARSRVVGGSDRLVLESRRATLAVPRLQVVLCVACITSCSHESMKLRDYGPQTASMEGETRAWLAAMDSKLDRVLETAFKKRLDAPV